MSVRFLARKQSFCKLLTLVLGSVRSGARQSRRLLPFFIVVWLIACTATEPVSTENYLRARSGFCTFLRCIQLNPDDELLIKLREVPVHPRHVRLEGERFTVIATQVDFAIALAANVGYIPGRRFLTDFLASMDSGEVIDLKVFATHDNKKSVVQIALMNLAAAERVWIYDSTTNAWLEDAIITLITEPYPMLYLDLLTSDSSAVVLRRMYGIR